MEGEITALALPDEQTFRRNIQAINRFQQIVHATMVKDQDYGVIPGTQKPTLLKPGAEKIAKLLGLADEYELLNQQEDWDKPFFCYLIRCNLRHFGSGTIVSQGLGECNSMENKYRWRDAKRVCPECKQEAIIKGQEQYGGGWLCYVKRGGCGAKWPDGAAEIEGQKLGRVENDDIYSLVNTILKMAKKRALVDAALSAGRLSNIFTQDMEDLEQLRKDDVPHKKPTQTQPKQASEGNDGPPEATEGQSEPKNKRDPKTISNFGQLWKATVDDFGLSRTAALAELGVSAQEDLTEKPADCYIRIAAARG